MMILIAGSMICTTSSPIRRSFWSGGIGCWVARGARTAGLDGETAHYVEAGVSWSPEMNPSLLCRVEGWRIAA
jgi:hypothetical protein